MNNYPTGSIESGVKGAYAFNIGQVLQEAWHRVKGNKGVIWGGILLGFLVLLGFEIAAGLLLAIMGLLQSQILITLASVIINIIGIWYIASMNGGIANIVVNRAIDQPASATDVFSCFSPFHKSLKLFAMMLLIYLVLLIPVTFMVVPIIFIPIVSNVMLQILMSLAGVIGFAVILYFTFSYFLATPLIANRDFKPWQALETSRKAISKHWFKIFFLWIVTFLITTIGAVITLGIGLIWLIPFANLVLGILYRIVFGVKTTSD